jgi:hypothetical protein
MPNEDGLYTQDEVLQIASRMLAGTTAKDLSDLLKDEESQNEDLGKFLGRISTNERKNLLDAEFGKGRKKASRKTERLLGEFFPNEDFEGMEQEEIFQKISTAHTKSDSKKTTNISFEQAMQIPEIANAFNVLQKKASRAEELEMEISNNSKISLFMEHAIPMLESMGASFSKDPVRRKRQIEILKNEAKNLNFKEDRELGLIFTDADGHRLMNKEEARHWDTKEYLKMISPVDFVEVVQTKDKTPYTPSNKAGSTDLNFGFSKEQITKGFTADEVKQARKDNPAKAEYMVKVMVENFENKQQQ